MRTRGYHMYLWVNAHPFQMQIFRLLRRTYRSILQWIDMISDVTVMLVLFNGDQKFFLFFCVMLFGIIAPYLIAWAVSLRWLDKIFRGKEKNCWTTFLSGNEYICISF